MHVVQPELFYIRFIYIPLLPSSGIETGGDGRMAYTCWAQDPVLQREHPNSLPQDPTVQLATPNLLGLADPWNLPRLCVSNEDLVTSSS